METRRSSGNHGLRLKWRNICAGPRHHHQRWTRDRSCHDCVEISPGSGSPPRLAADESEQIASMPHGFSVAGSAQRGEYNSPGMKGDIVAECGEIDAACGEIVPERGEIVADSPVIVPACGIIVAERGIINAASGLIVPAYGLIETERGLIETERGMTISLSGAFSPGPVSAVTSFREMLGEGVLTATRLVWSKWRKPPV